MEELCNDMIGEIIEYLDAPSLRSLRLTSKFFYERVNSKFTSYKSFVKKCLDCNNHVIIKCPFFKGLIKTFMNIPNVVLASTYTHYPISPFPSDLELLKSITVYRIDELDESLISNSTVVIVDRSYNYDYYISRYVSLIRRVAKRCVIYSQNFNDTLYDDKSFNVYEIPFLLKGDCIPKLRFELYISDTYDQSLSFFRKKQSRYYVQGYKNILIGNPTSDSYCIRYTFMYLTSLILFSTFKYVCKTPHIVTIYLLIPKRTRYIFECKLAVYSFLRLIDIPYYTTPRYTLGVRDVKKLNSKNILDYL